MRGRGRERKGEWAPPSRVSNRVVRARSTVWYRVKSSSAEITDSLADPGRDFFSGPSLGRSRGRRFWASSHHHPSTQKINKCFFLTSIPGWAIGRPLGPRGLSPEGSLKKINLPNPCGPHWPKPTHKLFPNTHSRNLPPPRGGVTQVASEAATEITPVRTSGWVSAHRTPIVGRLPAARRPSVQTFSTVVSVLDGMLKKLPLLRHVRQKSTRKMVKKKTFLRENRSTTALASFGPLANLPNIKKKLMVECF